MPGPTSTPQLSSCMDRPSFISDICCLLSGELAYERTCTLFAGTPGSDETATEPHSMQCVSRISPTLIVLQSGMHGPCSGCTGTMC